MNTPEPAHKKKKSSLLKSVLGAAFGVQSSRVQEADFQSRSPWRYVIAGLVFTILFVLALAWIVNRVVESSGLS